MSKKLFRSRKDRMIGGVAAGLGDYFDIDPTLVRIIFVVTLFLGGTGILAYIILWIVVPEEPVVAGTSDQAFNLNPAGENQETDNSYLAAMEAHKDKRRVFAGIIFIILGFVFLADNFIPRLNLGDFWPLILIAAGVALLLNARKTK